MTATDDVILILHAPDGEQWAGFLASRLGTPQYNIRTVVKDITVKEEQLPAPSDEIYTNTSECSSNSVKGKNDSNNNKNQTEKTTATHRQEKALVASRDSGRGSSSAVNESSSISDCLSNSKATVVLMSPDSLDSHPFPIDVSLFTSKRTVFLFLGVDIEETRAYFGDKEEQVFKCGVCIIDGSEYSICDAMVQIIEAYEYVGGGSDEDNEDIYHIPPSPKQLNRIEKVFPQELNEKDREVYILLERPAEEEVLAVLDCDMSQEIQLTNVCERLYKFTLPASVRGEVFFKVECQGTCFGEESVQILTKLDRLNSILKDEANPLAVLASALGLDKNDLGGIDTALAFKLQELRPVTTFKTMFPCEDALGGSDERSDALYPSLLHFAADYNLRTFCSELLKYPGMLAAACTENKNGDYPTNLAQKRGYVSLETELVQFVESNNSRIGHDDENLYVEPMPAQPAPPPKPHGAKKSSGYVNDQPPEDASFGSSYVDMANLHIMKTPFLDRLRYTHRALSESSLFWKKFSSKKRNLQSQRSDSEVLSPVSKSSDEVFGRMSPRSEYEDDDSNYHDMSGLRQEIDRPQFKLDSPTDERLAGDSSPGGTPRKALKLLGVAQEHIDRQLDTNSQFRSLPRGATGSRGHAAASMIPHATRFPSTSHLGSGAGLYSASHSQDQSMGENYSLDMKNRAVTSKIKSFFGKMKKGKRSNSDGEIIYGHVAGIKKSPSSISERSSRSGRSNESSGSRKKKSVLAESQERDSGSYSDEEKDKSSPLPTKKNKPRVFKERDKPMARRLSKRAQAALNERMNDAPNLPKTGRRKGEFRSFIQDEKF